MKTFNITFLNAEVCFLNESSNANGLGLEFIHGIKIFVLVSPKSHFRKEFDFSKPDSRYL